MEKLGFEKTEQENSNLGSLENPIIDSNMNIEDALRPNPNFEIPKEIFEKQTLIKVKYLSFDKKYHQGQIVVDKRLEQDVKDFFAFLIEQKFLVQQVVPIAHSDYHFDDNKSMAANNSSGFNPRFIANTNQLSKHGVGWAIDLNPVQNPFVSIKPEEKEVSGNFEYYNIEKPGTITPWIAEFLKKRGWVWGLEWYQDKDNPRVDIHHFEKILGEIPRL